MTSQHSPYNNWQDATHSRTSIVSRSGRHRAAAASRSSVTAVVAVCAIAAASVFVSQIQQSQATATLAGTATSLSLQAVADSYTTDVLPNATHGSEAQLKASSLGGYGKIIFLRFRVPDLGGQTVANADLVLTRTPHHLPLSTISAHAVTDGAWTEETLTANNAPALGAMMSTVVTTSLDDTATVPVTPAVTDAGYVTLAVTSPTAGYLGFQSKEAGAAAPVLNISLDSGPAPTASPSSTPAPSASASSALAPSASASRTPTPVSQGVTFGLDVATNAGTFGGTQAQLEALARQGYQHGLGVHTKFYDGGKGITATYNSLVSSGYGADPSETAPYLCWRGAFNRADFISVLTKVVARFTANTGVPVWVTNDQEPENKAITAADYISKIKAMSAAIAATPALVGKVQIVPALMAYQEIDAHNQVLNWKTLVQPVAPLVAAVSWDLYDMDYSTTAWSAKYNLDIIRAASQTLKLPYFLGEWATVRSIKDGTDTEAKRAARAQDVIDYLRADAATTTNRYGALGGNWWENYQGIANNPASCASGLLKAWQAGTTLAVLNTLRAAMR